MYRSMGLHRKAALFTHYAARWASKIAESPDQVIEVSPTQSKILLVNVFAWYPVHIGGLYIMVYVISVQCHLGAGGWGGWCIYFCSLKVLLEHNYNKVV